MNVSCITNKEMRERGICAGGEEDVRNWSHAIGCYMGVGGRREGGVDASRRREVLD